LTLHYATYENEKNAAQFFASTVEHLYVIRSIDYSLSTFYALKSLKEYFSALEQLEQLQTLTYLKKLVIWFSTDDKNSRLISIELASLLFIKNAFPMLEHCYIAKWPLLIAIPDVHNVSLPMLCFLTICLSRDNDFDRLLVACPNLVSLDINC
jgi:hypothetical protein